MEVYEVLLETGQLYYEKGEFLKAIDRLEKAAEGLFDQGFHERFLTSQCLLLRIYAELERHEDIARIRMSIHKWGSEPEAELNSKTLYALGICSVYQQNCERAQKEFQEALRLALIEDNKSDICHAISGLAMAYYQLGQLTEALTEIYNLQVFFQLLDIPELNLVSRLLNGAILRKMGKPDQALEVYWRSYELIRQSKNMYLHIYLLFGLGLAYCDQGEQDQAELYLQLARRTVDPQNLRHLARRIDEKLQEMGIIQQDEYDLVFDSTANSVIEKKRGRIDFRNQFILVELLNVLIRSPGEVHSKESLVKRVWNQDYNPAIHDNKIYVTIKRLRQLIEPEYEKPKYIFRAKNGYYLSKKARVRLLH